jgi:hypothetical protein
MEASSRNTRQSSVTDAAPVSAPISAARMGLVSAICSASTKGLRAQALARMPPTHPAPMTPTLIWSKFT